MIPINRTYAPLQVLVDELARCGMRHAVTSPGSRNAPIALTLAAQEEIDSVSVIDERAAGFMALGMAKASGLPVAVTCTSGTAAANLAPAVYEAAEARVPLVVLTADRPPELRQVGAGQAIDQVKIFGSAAKRFVEVGSHEPGRATAVHHRALACRAYWTALGDRPGPVHLNLALREPLDPSPEELDTEDWEGRGGGRPWVISRAHPAAPADADAEDLGAQMAATPRGAIVCGSVCEAVAEPVARLAAATGWPVLADPMSGLRCGEHDRSHVVSHYDVLLRDPNFAAMNAATLVLRVGDTPTSKPLRKWLAGTAQVVIDPHGAWHEPTRQAVLLLRCGAAAGCAALAAAAEARPEPPDGQWRASWREADALVPETLASWPAGSEPRVYSAPAGALPSGSLVWLASSMPVRDVESFWPTGPEELRFLSNRGANGIDGTIASAAGAARASGRPTLVLLGELALLHDIGGLLAARRAGIDLTMLCVNNGGGGIFEFLPVAGSASREAFEEHVATPSGLDLAAVAALAGMEHRLCAGADDLPGAIQAGPGLIEVRTDRTQNVDTHRAIADRVREELS